MHFSDPLTHAVKNLSDQKLLDVQYQNMKIDGAQPAWIRIDSNMPLTPLGEKFIQFRHQAKEPNFSDSLLDPFKDELPSILIQNLIDFVSNI